MSQLKRQRDWRRRRVVINAATTLLYMKGRHDINTKGPTCTWRRMPVVSVGVMLANLAINLTGPHG